MKEPWRVLPPEFLTKLESVVGPQAYQHVCEAFSIRRPITLRANTLKTSATELSRELDLHGVVYERVVWNTHAFVILSPPLRDLTGFPFYKEGRVYVQSLSSMIPALILDPKDNEKILDCTAAPGSKTTQMAALMRNSGKIVANDISTVRRYKLAANLTLQGVTNTTITALPAQGLWQTYPEYFDKTLVDVPCSMEGRFASFDDKTYKDWSQAKVKTLSKAQKWILRSAISATKPGGVIVYATCTLSPEENEAVIDWILNKERGKLVLETIAPEGLPAFRRGLISWKGKKFPHELEKTIRIDPSGLQEGFFVAKLRKIARSVGSAAHDAID